MGKLKHAGARWARWAAAMALVSAAATPAAADTPNLADAQALTAQLAADLASHASATAVLQGWCADRDLAEPADIVAEQQAGRVKPATAKVRALLHAAPDEPIRYRRVALACGRRVLSRADNWYRPGQLTAAMNAALDSTDTPFGVVVQPLQFHRESLAAKVLIKPDATKVPAEIIRNEALLETPDGTPFSLVIETYSRTLLDFGPKPARGGRSRGSMGRTPRGSRATVVVTEGATIVSPPPRVRHRHEPAAPKPRTSEHERSAHVRTH